MDGGTSDRSACRPARSSAPRVKASSLCSWGMSAAISAHHRGPWEAWGYRLAACGCRLVVRGCRLAVSGCRLAVSGCRLHKGLRLHRVADWPPRRAAPSQAEARAPAWLSASPFASVAEPSPRGGYTSAGPLPLASFLGRPLRAAAAAVVAAVDVLCTYASIGCWTRHYDWKWEI